MANITYNTESTTLVLNGYVFNNLIAGESMQVAPVNPATSRANSANGVSVSGRSDKDVHNLTVRVQKNSQDDIFLNSARNSSAPTIFDGSLKENFNKDGADGVDGWTLEGGSITTLPTSVKNNTEVDAAHEYVIEFRFATRSL